MLGIIKKERWAQLLVLLFLLLSLDWFYLTLFKEPEDSWHTYFTNIYGVVALVGGIYGLFLTKRWGGVKSLMGRAIFFLSLGLLLQECGQIIYIYYIQVLNIPIPYPSWGDLGYFGSIPCYALGAYYLARVSGVKLSLNKLSNKIVCLVLPALLLLGSYYFFIQGYSFKDNPPLKIFLDFGYPFGQVLYVSIALLTYFLSRGVLGGIMKNAILFILFSLVFQYFSDFFFLYQTNNGTLYFGGINDYMYLISYFLMSMSILQLKIVSDKLMGNNLE